jgi:DNA-directed RNA polymerase specialized sigma24 family protein
MPIKLPLITDRLLAKRCLAHDDAAWQQLYDRYEPVLARFISRLLYSGAVDGNSPADIAHDVLTSLCDDNYRRLRRYKAGRRPLLVYLCVLARQRVQALLRRERCRKKHEVCLADYDPPDPGITVAFLEAGLQAVSEALTRQELKYYQQKLLGNREQTAPATFTRANAKKLRQRVKAKARAVADRP